MQVKYTTAFILLLASVLAAPDAALIRRDTESDDNPLVDLANDIVHGFGDIISYFHHPASESPSHMSDLEVPETGWPIIPAISTAISDVQSEVKVIVSMARTATGPVASSLSSDLAALYNSMSSMYGTQISILTAQTPTAQTQTAQISTSQTPTTENKGSSTTNQVTKKRTTSSSTAGAVMPTSGLGISLAGLAGIVGVVAIAL
jgi:hypothetical protein